MQVLTIHTSVRFRAGQGQAMFYDPFNECFVDNGEHASVDEDGVAKGSWVTLEPGAQVSVVMAYGKGSTFCLIANDDEGTLVSENSYGLVVREMSMKKILENVMINACMVDEVVQAA